MSSPDFAAMGQAVLAVPELQSIYNVLRVNLIYLSAITAIFVWDWLSQLPREVRLIWKTRWTVVKALTIFARYWTLCAVILVVAFFSRRWDPETCRTAHVWEPAVTVPTVMAVETLLALRVVSIWANDRRIIATVVLLVSGVFVALVVGTSKTVALVMPPGALGCISTNGADDKPAMLVFYLLPLVADASFLCLMIARSLQLRRQSISPPPIVQLILKDQLQMFAVVVFVTGLNTAFFAQNANVTIQPINAALNLAAPTTFACRMVLNLREQALNGGASRDYGGMTGIATGIVPIGSSASRGSGSARKHSIGAPHHIELSPSHIRTTVDTHVATDKDSLAEKAATRGGFDGFVHGV